MQNVWGMLRSLVQIVVIWNRLHPDLVAAIDGLRIWVDPALTTAEWRCFLAHEAFHIKHGHQGCQPPSIERQICLETARFMVSFEGLRRVAGWSRSIWVMADELGAAEQVVIGRLQAVGMDQIQYLWRASGHIA